LTSETGSKVGREKLFVGAPLEFFGRRANGLGSGRIGKNIAAGSVLDPRKSRQVVHEALETFLALAQRLDRLNFVCQVDIDADETKERSGAGKSGLCIDLEDAVLARSVAKTSLDGEAAARRQCGLHLLTNVTKVFRMQL